MPFSCLIINLLTLILKGAKGEGGRGYISVREQKLPENKVGTASPELMSPRRTQGQKTPCAALGWCSTPLLSERGEFHAACPFPHCPLQDPQVEGQKGWQTTQAEPGHRPACCDLAFPPTLAEGERALPTHLLFDGRCWDMGNGSSSSGQRSGASCTASEARPSTSPVEGRVGPSVPAVGLAECTETCTAGPGANLLSAPQHGMLCRDCGAAGVAGCAGKGRAQPARPPM